MTFLLVTLLTFAITVTVVGVYFTIKTQSGNQPAEFMVARGSRRIIDPIPIRGRRVVDVVPVSRRSVVQSIPMRAHRYTGATGLRPARYLSAAAVWSRINGRRTGEPVSWTVITIGLISIIILGFYALNLLLPHRALLSFVLFNQQVASAVTRPQQQPTYSATQDLVRISQVNPAQYSSSQEYSLWAYSACSTASMTEVINAYGHHYRITDILKVEAQIGEITPHLGLLEDIGIQRTVAHFGFKTTWGYHLSLDQIIGIANHDRPVIVAFPPARYDGGHLVVVTGGNSNYVYVADSSLWNRHSISRAQFLNWWEGFYAIVTPK